MKFWTPSVKVGLMVVVAIVLLAILLTNAGNWPWATRGDDIYFEFRAVNGLYVGSGVLLSGVSIGKVTSIELKPETSTVEIRARVKNAFQWLRKGCDAGISMSGFVGETYITLNNGEVGNPFLQPSDLPIIGIDPVNPLELLEQTSSGLSKAIELTTAANEVLQASQEEIQEGIKETRKLVELTSKTLTKFSEHIDTTVETLQNLTSKYDVRFESTLSQVDKLLNQLGNDSLILSSQISDVSRSILRMIDQNSPKVNSMITDLQRSTSDFRRLATQFRQDSSSLKTEISDLIAQGSTFIEKGSTDVAPIIENLQNVTAAFTTLEKNISELLNTIQYGDGTVAQLLNNPEPIKGAQESFNNLNEVLTGLKGLYQQTDKQLKGFKLPKYSWDTELQYLSREENLHTEFGFSLIPSPPSKNMYHFGLSIREEIIGVDFQYAYNFTDYLRGKFGFMRSNLGAGFDLWLLSRRLGIGMEGIRITSDKPELNAEMSFRFFRGGHVLFGVENWWRDERRWTTGLKWITNDW
ncbi:MAG: MlaD family protein [Candidatus Poribacteria bacterium]|nr:MlaD family protein [Candidatus Poribacteria bacterium]